MKIKNIAAICKRKKSIVLFNRYSARGNLMQYISDGSACYPVVGLPELDGESLLTIFGVPEKDRDKYIVREADAPEGINLDDADAEERPIEKQGISIVYSGRVLNPLQTRRGLVFIESRYLSPVSDVMDVLELYERFTPSGTPYIAAKAGFLLQAVIMPFDAINQQFVDQMQELTRQCAFALELKKRTAEREKEEEPEQYSLNVDPETGEVVGGEGAKE